MSHCCLDLSFLLRHFEIFDDYCVSSWDSNICELIPPFKEFILSLVSGMRSKEKANVLLQSRHKG